MGNRTPKQAVEVIDALAASDEDRGKLLSMSYKSVQRLKERLPQPIANLVQNEHGRAVLRAILEDADQGRAA